MKAAYFTGDDLIEKFPGHTTWQTNTLAFKRLPKARRKGRPDSYLPRTSSHLRPCHPCLVELPQTHTQRNRWKKNTESAATLCRYFTVMDRSPFRPDLTDSNKHKTQFYDLNITKEWLSNFHFTTTASDMCSKVSMESIGQKKRSKELAANHADLPLRKRTQMDFFSEAISN